MSAKAGISAALVLAALGLAACGSGSGGGTIPEGDAEALLSQLKAVEDRVANRDCSVAQTEASQFVTLVNGLPQEVGAETKAGLREAGENLLGMTQDPAECEEPDDKQTTTPPTDAGATGAAGAEEDG